MLDNRRVDGKGESGGYGIDPDLDSSPLETVWVPAVQPATSLASIELRAASCLCKVSLCEMLEVSLSTPPLSHTF